MIFALLLSFLSQTTVTPEDHGRSSFVDFDHQHEWVKLDEFEEGSVWWDRNSINRIANDQGEFPVILQRVVFNPGSPWARLETWQAIDCKNNQFGSFNGSVNFLPRRTHQIVEFADWPKPESEAVQNLMLTVCGSDWKQ